MLARLRHPQRLAAAEIRCGDGRCGRAERGSPQPGGCGRNLRPRAVRQEATAEVLPAVNNPAGQGDTASAGMSYGSGAMKPHGQLNVSVKSAGNLLYISSFKLSIGQNPV